MKPFYNNIMVLCHCGAPDPIHVIILKRMAKIFLRNDLLCSAGESGGLELHEGQQIMTI